VLPSGQPTAQPSLQPTSPTGQPTEQPTAQPSAEPTSPTGEPSGQPTRRPTMQPTGQPSGMPTSTPRPTKTGDTNPPTGQPTSWPTAHPTNMPSAQPSRQPSSLPTGKPSGSPTGQPTSQPTNPTGKPTGQPTGQPSEQPSCQPTGQPTHAPSTIPSGQPTSKPSRRPSAQPTAQPSAQPTLAFAAEVKIPLHQEFLTSLSPSDFLSNVEAVRAFEQGIAALVRAEKEGKKKQGRKVLVTGAKQKAEVRMRRLLPSTGIIIDYTILVEVNDIQPASIEFTVATITNAMAAPTFTSALAAAMSLVPSIPAIAVVPPDPPKIEHVTFEVLRTPWPTHAPTNTAEAEEADGPGFLDSAGSKIGLSVGFAFVIIASWYAYKRKKISATREEMSSIHKNGIDLEAAEAVTNDDEIVSSTFALGLVDVVTVPTADVTGKCPVSRISFFHSPVTEVSSYSVQSDEMKQDERIYNELESVHEVGASNAASLADRTIGISPRQDLQTDTDAYTPAAHLSRRMDANASIDAASMDSIYYLGHNSHFAYTDDKMRAALKGTKVSISSNMRMPSIKQKVLLQPRMTNAKKGADTASSVTQTQTAADNSLSAPPHLSPIETSATQDSSHVSASEIHHDHDLAQLNILKKGAKQKPSNTEDVSSQAADGDVFSDVSSEENDAEGEIEGEGEGEGEGQ